MFAALALTGRRAGVPTAWLLPTLTLYAIASEVVQAVPALGRSASVWDALADVVGIALGWLLARLVR
ncbi:VanZ family protein [Cryptosporangium minutisporangium]|uniref:VanZ family protein n=1 Tax=Cryptosporangium minutisporangium TaxID=113569 RepID=UPI0031EC94A0